MSETRHTREVNPDVDYEKNDINVFYIAAVGVLIIVAAIVIFAGVRRLFNYFDAHIAGEDKPPVSLVHAARRTPPEPRLQVNPADDLQRLRISEDAALHGYGWVDGQAGVVRIPIEQAMKLIVERGLPSGSQPASQPTSPTNENRNAATQATKVSIETNPARRQTGRHK